MRLPTAMMICAMTLSTGAVAEDIPWPETTLEVFKLAPGKQEAFIRGVAAWDEVSRAGGQPATQIYFGGDGFDVLLLKAPRPKPTDEQNAAMAAKAKAMKLPSGPELFLAMRESVASHIDTKATGPLTAAVWLAKLDRQRGQTSVPSSSEIPPIDPPRAGDEWPRTTFEFFKLAPGKQEAFLRRVAIWDEVSRAGGQPASVTYFHDSGDDWDVLLLKPPRPAPTAKQDATMAAKARELNLESGPEYFLGMRQNVATFSNTVATGPLTAAEWLARLDRQRAERAQRGK